MPYIHKLNKKGNGRYVMKPTSMLSGSLARHHKRTYGSGITSEVYENGRLHKATETLRNLKVAKPRLPKKYITFD